MRSLALALSVLALLLAGCGSERQQAGSETPTAPVEPQPAPTDTATLPNAAPMVVALYFLRDGKVGVTQREIVAGPKVGAAALEALIDGPTDIERYKAGLETEIPSRTRLGSLSISDGTAHAVFSSDLNPRATAEVVYTLTQFPTVKRVSLGGGLPLTRADLEGLTPQILVESPAAWERVSSPLRMAGTANTFEATFNLELLDSRGSVLAKRFVTATSGSGTRGTFETAVKFRGGDPGSSAWLVVYESSAEDGSRLHEVKIPLILAGP